MFKFIPPITPLINAKKKRVDPLWTRLWHHESCLIVLRDADDEVAFTPWPRHHCDISVSSYWPPQSLQITATQIRPLFTDHLLSDDIILFSPISPIESPFATLSSKDLSCDVTAGRGIFEVTYWLNVFGLRVMKISRQHLLIYISKYWKFEVQFNNIRWCRICGMNMLPEGFL